MSARLGAVLLILLSLSVPSFAQGTDISLEVFGESTSARLTTTYILKVSWTASEPVQNVVLEADFPGDVRFHEAGMQCAGARSIRCTLPSVAEHFARVSVVVTFPGPGTYTSTARVTSETPDPNPANNAATVSTFVSGLPSLRVHAIAEIVDEGFALDPGGVGRLRIGVDNDGETATNVVFRVTLPEGGTFLDIDPYYANECTASAAEVVCRLEMLRSFDFRQVSLPLVAPDRAEGGTFPVVVSVDADQEDIDPEDDVYRTDVPLRRLFAVTSAADEGLGTLRQAILDSRVFCETVACLIGVRMTGSIVIQPRTALPKLRGRVKVDGGTARPILDGSLLATGGALHFEEGCDFRVNGLVIRNFEGHAIEAHQTIVDIGRACGWNVLQTPAVITNNELTGNLRGVVTRGISATIADNVIRDHVRSGIIADHAYYTYIVRNEITGNGASGIFVDAPDGPNTYLPPGADVLENVVRGNAHWGITMRTNGSVHVARNSVSRNYLYGIDVGVDLDSPPTFLEPVIVSATYDPARGATILRGQVGHARYGTTRIDVYSSSSLSVWGYPDAEQWVGEYYAGGNFELAIPRDLRGKWITTTGTEITGLIFLREEGNVAAPPRYQSYDTSELSNAVQVQ